jgi:hypothetical protein
VLDDKEGPSFEGIDEPLGGMRNVSIICGMFTAHFTDDQPKGNQRIISQFGVGVMLPSSYIREGLMTDELREERRRWDAEQAATKAAKQPN